MWCDGMYSFFALLFCDLLCRCVSCAVLWCVVLCCYALFFFCFFVFAVFLMWDMHFILCCCVVLCCDVIWYNLLCCSVLRAHVVCTRVVHVFAYCACLCRVSESFACECQWFACFYFVFDFFHSCSYVFFCQDLCQGFLSNVFACYCSCEPQTCARVVLALSVFFCFFLIVFGWTRCFRARSVCAIVMFCSHVDAACTCESVCHTCVRGHVIDRSVCGYVFLYIFFWSSCSPCALRACALPCVRRVLVVCSSCARRVLIVGSSWDRRLLVLVV